MAQLRDAAKDFKKAHVQVVLVGMGSPEESEKFKEQFQVPFPLVCDPERKLYKLYGLKRMGMLDFLSPSLALKSLGAVVQGHGVGMPEGDVKQLAGVFIIDAQGVVCWQYLSADPPDFASAEDILEALKEISS